MAPHRGIGVAEDGYIVDCSKFSELGCSGMLILCDARPALLYGVNVRQRTSNPMLKVKGHMCTQTLGICCRCSIYSLAI